MKPMNILDSGEKPFATDSEIVDGQNELKCTSGVSFRRFLTSLQTGSLLGLSGLRIILAWSLCWTSFMTLSRSVLTLLLQPIQDCTVVIDHEGMVTLTVSLQAGCVHSPSTRFKGINGSSEFASSPQSRTNSLHEQAPVMQKSLLKMPSSPPSQKPPFTSEQSASIWQGMCPTSTTRTLGIKASTWFLHITISPLSSTYMPSW
mmetsp:Transcript_6019/g.14366  ORF Transcript_6019/g.14366 Transcript_6019/m.14366 type:complete len:203 (+) Transcript_6019:781-1389(+)